MTEHLVRDERIRRARTRHGGLKKWRHHSEKRDLEEIKGDDGQPDAAIHHLYDE